MEMAELLMLKAIIEWVLLWSVLALALASDGY
jgi:hypothetical protein